MSHRAATRWLVFVFVIAVGLRLGLIWATPHFAPNNDPADYDRIAHSLASGHGFAPTLLAAPGTPSALRPPAYPLLLALVYALGGHWLAGRVANALLGVVVVLLVYAIARKVWNERTAVVAAGLAAVFPPLIALNASLLSEPLFLVLELLVVLAVLCYQAGRRRLVWAGVIGVLCGAAALTRSVGLLLPIAAIVGMCAAPSSTRRQALTSVAVLLTALCVTMAPWTIRNAGAFHGAFVPVSTQDGITAAGTYNDEAARPGSSYTAWRPPYFVASFRHLFYDSLDEAQLDSTLRRDALSYAVSHPGYVIATIGLNSLRMLNVGPRSSAVSQEWYYEMGIAPSVQPWITIGGDLLIAVAILGAVAAITRFRRRRRQPLAVVARHGFMWLVPLMMYAASVPITGAFRYRAPVDPFFMFLAAYAVLLAAARLSRHSHP